jgi:hypothetical protein
MTPDDTTAPARARQGKPAAPGDLSFPGGRRLCAHADRDGAGMHWLQPGQTCRSSVMTTMTDDRGAASRSAAGTGGHNP